MCLVLQSCPALWDPVGILQARMLEWIALPSSRGSSQPRGWTQVSHLADAFFTGWATREAWGQGRQSLTAVKCLCLSMLSSNLSLSLSVSPLFSQSISSYHHSYFTYGCHLCIEEIFFFSWKHKISQILVTLTPQLYIKIRRKFYLKTDLNKCSVRGQIYSLLTFNLVCN